MIDNLSWDFGQVYGSVTDKLMTNLTKYFKRIKPGQAVPTLREWQTKMYRNIGKIYNETKRIISRGLKGADKTLSDDLVTAINEGLRDEELKLRREAERKLMEESGGELPPDRNPRNTNAYQALYRQSADKLNLVNTVMLESTLDAYRGMVTDIYGKIARTQTILNEAAESAIVGEKSWNEAMRNAVDRMVENGLTGFVDHGGHKWSPEAYAAMDIRTTMMNASRAVVWERMEEYGTDLYQVSSHLGARPLCYPWQGKVISRNNHARDIVDGEGNPVHVYAQNETTYGQAAGLFGVNCGHYPMVFIEGVSRLKSEPQDEEDNARTYAESQKQRGLERKLRKEKLQLEILKARDEDPETIKDQRAKVREASRAIKEFCEETGRTRLREREYTPVNAEFPEGGS